MRRFLAVTSYTNGKVINLWTAQWADLLLHEYNNSDMARCHRTTSSFVLSFLSYATYCARQVVGSRERRE